MVDRLHYQESPFAIEGEFHSKKKRRRVKPAMVQVIYPVPLCHLTPEMLPVLIDYHTLRDLAHRSMGVTLTSFSAFSVFRIDSARWAFENEEKATHKLFEKKWKRMSAFVRCSSYPQAMAHMNSLSQAYVCGEYDENFKLIQQMPMKHLKRLIRFFELLLARVHEASLEW